MSEPETVQCECGGTMLLTAFMSLQRTSDKVIQLPGAAPQQKGPKTAPIPVTFCSKCGIMKMPVEQFKEDIQEAMSHEDDE